MERNKSIDLTKFVMSICIIAIHSQIFKNIDSSLYYAIPMGIMRIAVPLFFVISGYYFYQRLQQGQETKNYIMSLVKLFLIFEAIELVLYLPFYRMQPGFNILLYLWKSLSTGLGGAYWYIISLIISFVLVKEFWKKQKVLPGMIVGLILYLFVFSVDSYAGIFNGTIIQKLATIHTWIWTWPQAGLCSSLFFISLGAYIYQKKPQFKVSLIYVIISMAILVIEAYLLQSTIAMDGNCYLTLLICVPLIFLYLLQHPHTSFKTKQLGQMSTYIYMAHPIVLTILRAFIPFLSYNYEVLFIVTTFICIVIAYMITLKRKSNGIVY